MNVYSKPKYFQIMAIVAIIVGIILVAYPVTALSYIVITIGALLILSAASSLVEYYRLKNEHHISTSSSIMLNSVVSILIGGLLIISPLFVIDILVKILSIILLIASCAQVVTFMSLKSKKVVVPMYMFIAPLILLIASLIMIFASIQSVATIIMMFGVGIIIYAAVELFSYYTINKRD